MLSLAEEERKWAPIKALQAQASETAKKLRDVERERLKSIPDPERYVDDTVGPNVRMTSEQAATYNREQANLYRQSHPDVYWCPELTSMLGSYFEKEKLKLISASMLETIINRFDAAGLLPERPEVFPVIEAEPEPIIEQPRQIENL